MSISEEGRPQHLKDLFVALCIYVVLIMVHGYRFGDEDMSETLSYALYLKDTTLFPQDLYIQSVGSSIWNERFPFTMLLSLFSDHLPAYAFVLHLLSSLSMILGLWHLSRIWLRSTYLQIAFILVALIPLYNITLGGNEIWYNYFVPSHAAKCIAIWSFYFFFRERITLAYSFLIGATLMQPVVGAQIALLFAVVSLHQILVGKSQTWQQVLPGVVIYGLTSGLWVGTIFISHLIHDASITDNAFYDIMETRLAHHFFPAYYPFKNYVFLGSLMIASSFLWRRISSKMAILFVYSILGMILYYILIEGIEIPAILSVQWFKITVWLKPFSLLVFLIYVERNTDFTPSRKLVIGFSSLAFVVIIGCALSGIGPFQNKPYHVPWNDTSDPVMRSAYNFGSQLPVDACLIIPPDMTGIRYPAQRSLFVDYKSNIHSKEYMSEAHQRRVALYDMRLEVRQAGKDIVAEGAKFYRSLRASDFRKYMQKGATHVVTWPEHQLPLEITYQDSTLIVYKL